MILQRYGLAMILICAMHMAYGQQDTAQVWGYHQLAGTGITYQMPAGFTRRIDTAGAYAHTCMPDTGLSLQVYVVPFAQQTQANAHPQLQRAIEDSDEDTLRLMVRTSLLHSQGTLLQLTDTTALGSRALDYCIGLPTATTQTKLVFGRIFKRDGKYYMLFASGASYDLSRLLTYKDEFFSSFEVL